MDRLLNTVEKEEVKEEFSFKNYFVPLTTAKAITWIVVIGFIVFANMLFNGFVWDDETYILLNTQIHSLNILASFKGNFFNSVGQYRPIPDLYFSLIYIMFSTNSFFYHILQLLLHIGCTILLFFLLRRFLPIIIAFFSSLIFLIHPIQVESVSYIAQTTNQIFFLFGIIPLFILHKKILKQKDLVYIYFLLVLSLLTKETGALFIPIMIIYCMLFTKQHLKKILILTPLILISYLTLRLYIGDTFFTGRTVFPIVNLSIIDRLLNIPAIVFYYLKTLFFPLTLTIDQQWIVTKLSFSSFYMPLIIDILFFIFLGVLGFFIHKENKKDFKSYVFFLCWFIVGLTLTLQIFPLDLTVADRWFYFQMAGFVGMFGIVIKVLNEHNKKLKLLIYTGIIIIVILLSMRTIIRNTNWKDTLTLFTHDSKIEDNYDIENNIGLEYLGMENYKDATLHYKLSEKLKPLEINLVNLGVAYEDTDDFSDAKKYFSLAFNAPSYDIYFPNKHGLYGYFQYGLVLTLSGNLNFAESLINQGLKEYPSAADLWFLETLVNYEQGKISQALIAANNAHNFNPRYYSDILYLNIKHNFPIEFTSFNKKYIFKPNSKNDKKFRNE